MRIVTIDSWLFGVVNDKIRHSRYLTIGWLKEGRMCKLTGAEGEYCQFVTILSIPKLKKTLDTASSAVWELKNPPTEL